VIIPVGDNVIPTGSDAPFGETSKVPPLKTVLGSVGTKSKLCSLPTMKVGRLGFHAVPAGAGAGTGAGGGELSEPDWLATPQPTRRVAQLQRESFNAVRRQIFVIRGAIHHMRPAREQSPPGQVRIGRDGLLTSNSRLRIRTFAPPRLPGAIVLFSKGCGWILFR
jgi:hypothetical protein